MDEGLNKINKKQYENFRKYFYEDLRPILGEDYYNMGLDTYTCDMLMMRDIRRKYDKLLVKNKLLTIELKIAIGLMLTCLLIAMYAVR